MKVFPLLFVLLFGAAPVLAETLVAARTIRPREVIGPSDVHVAPGSRPGALTEPARAIGREAKWTIYEGRAIADGDLIPAAVVERNQIVELVYESSSLSIRAEGRALGRGAIGSRVRVMNLGSRNTVSGTVSAPGQVLVQ